MCIIKLKRNLGMTTMCAVKNADLSIESLNKPLKISLNVQLKKIKRIFSKFLL